MTTKTKYKNKRIPVKIVTLQPVNSLSMHGNNVNLGSYPSLWVLSALMIA